MKNKSSPTFTIIIPQISGCRSTLFVTNTSEIFISTTVREDRIERWTTSGTRLQWSVPLPVPCDHIFLDANGSLYCTLSDHHRVVRVALNEPNRTVSTVAGTGCWGSGVYELNTPQGIFVSANQDLYVADSWNQRVQRFRLGELNGTTVAGNGAPGTISFHNPNSVILDFDGYLFISDYHNHRVIGSGPFGFRCIVGCSGGSGSSSTHLSYPTSISFDSEGNLYVLDSGNRRLQRFQLTSSDPSGIQHHLYLVRCDLIPPLH
jgi:hypothetical protein